MADRKPAEQAKKWTGMGGVIDAPVPRPAMLSDIDLLFSFEIDSFAKDRLSRRSMRAFIKSPRADFLLSEDQGAVVASALFLYRNNSQNIRLYSIAVTPRAQGRGLARALLLQGARTAQARGKQAITLEVSDNNPKAHLLYTRLGFRETGYKPCYYSDESAAWSMRAPLKLIIERLSLPSKN